MIINSEKDPASFGVPDEFKVKTFDATSLALKYGLGSKAAPIVNMPMLGAFARTTGFLGLEALLDAVRMESPIKKDENVEAAKEAFESA